MDDRLDYGIDKPALSNPNPIILIIGKTIKLLAFPTNCLPTIPPIDMFATK